MNHAFLTSNVRVEKNFEALLMKVIQSLGSGVGGEILNFINESLGRSHRAK